MKIDLAAVRTATEHITGAWRAQALYTAVKLRLPDHIASGHTTDRELARAAGTDEVAVQRLMRLLVAMKVFEGNGTSGYRNTPVSVVLSDQPGSMRDMCLLHGEEYYAAWAHAFEAITTQRSGFELAFGMPFYAGMGQNKDLSDRFQSALKAGNGFFDYVPEVFDFSGKHVVDIAGGTGELLSVILAASPGSRGTLLDREHVVAPVREGLRAEWGAQRVAVVGADMFDGVPHGGDVYVLSRVFAGHSDEAVTLLLKDVRQAMGAPDARLVILDRFLVDEDSALVPAMWDLHLLMMVGGGHRTLATLHTLLDQAGLTVERTAELPMDYTATIVSAR
ncbi:methyltransferase [Actinophytocola sp.]|uniref:methyltransferase n=1 Tax=Actinophytocola sp. TaxID=1872138 RepID=UPI002ED26CA2